MQGFWVIDKMAAYFSKSLEYSKLDIEFSIWACVFRQIGADKSAAWEDKDCDLGRIATPIA